MEIKKKFLTRQGWLRITESRFAFCNFERVHLSGVAALMELTRVREPLVAEFRGEKLKIVDDGYYWLQVAPEGENYWITVMYDESGKCLQYYFDMTLSNVIDGKNSHFYDLFLDLVAMPDGRLIVLDGDELEDAFNEGVISVGEKAIALDTCLMLKEGIPARHEALDEFCTSLFIKLKNRL